MKELEWIKELEEDFKSGDKERFPTRAHITYWENVPADDENRKLMAGINKIYMPYAINGDYAEMRHLGEYYFVGRPVLQLPANYKKAIYWYSRAAEYKCAYRGEVLYKLAYCYKYARGANKDAVKAFKMLEALAKIDCSKMELPERAEFTADANICLADCYYRGIGTEKSVEKALAIWEKYANEGDETACRNLGREYLSGKYLKRDYEKAFYWTQRAADMNDTVAINNLGWCYENGYGTEKNIEEAVKCYKEAAGEGNVVAKNNVKRLKKKGIIADDEDI